MPTNSERNKNFTCLIVPDINFPEGHILQCLNQHFPEFHVLQYGNKNSYQLPELIQSINPHLIFSPEIIVDLSLEFIFKESGIIRPVIFTSYKKPSVLPDFCIGTIEPHFKQNEFDLLIAKFKNLYTAFNNKVSEGSIKTTIRRYKDRFLAKSGSRSFFIFADDVSYFVADNKIVYLIDKSGNKYLINHTIEKLTAQLNPNTFFRINRKIIINNKAIVMVKPYNNNRLRISLNNPTNSIDLIISRNRVPRFKQWANGDPINQ